MPKKAKELTAMAVTKLKAEGKHAVGGVDGLYLRITGNSRSWVLCVTMGYRTNAKGKEVPNRLSMGLGSFPDVSLAEAREKARELRKKIRQGINPVEEKRKRRTEAAKKGKTFIDCAEAVLEKKAHELKNAKNLNQWRSTLETYVYPFIGKMLINEISKSDIVSVLNPIWLTKNETASRVRGRIESVFDYAKAMEFRTKDNPADWKTLTAC